MQHLQTLKPKENDLNGSLFSLLNFAAVRLTDGGNVPNHQSTIWKAFFIE